jgi:hypothetical protein
LVRAIDLAFGLLLAAGWSIIFLTVRKILPLGIPPATTPRQEEIVRKVSTVALGLIWVVGAGLGVVMAVILWPIS